MDRMDPNPLPPHMMGGSSSAGTTKNRKRGWAGDEMEMNHKIQQKLTSTSSTTAVDLSQFRNEEVGRGYQTKGVVRQKTIGGVINDGNQHHGQHTMKIIDMSIKQTSSTGYNKDEDMSYDKTPPVAKSKKSKKQKKTSKERERANKKEEEETIKMILQCDGIRTFRKEIEKIAIEASKKKSNIY